MTPARLELLRAVDAGSVRRHESVRPVRPRAIWVHDSGEWEPVTARVKALCEADLIELDRTPVRLGEWKGSCRYVLTAAGRAILAQVAS